MPIFRDDPHLLVKRELNRSAIERRVLGHREFGRGECRKDDEGNGAGVMAAHETLHQSMRKRRIEKLNVLPGESAAAGQVALLHHYTFLIYHGVVPLNLKNTDVERLATEVAELTGESKTEAIRKALEERRRRLKGSDVRERRERLLKFLKAKVWSDVPKKELGRRLSREEEDAILGYGPEGA